MARVLARAIFVSTEFARDPVIDDADRLRQQVGTLDVIMIRACDIVQFFVRISNCIIEPLGMAGRAGEIGAVVDDEHRASDACGVTNSGRVGVIIAPL